MSDAIANLVKQANILKKLVAEQGRWVERHKRVLAETREALRAAAKKAGIDYEEKKKAPLEEAMDILKRLGKEAKVAESKREAEHKAFLAEEAKAAPEVKLGRAVAELKHFDTSGVDENPVEYKSLSAGKYNISGFLGFIDTGERAHRIPLPQTVNELDRDTVIATVLTQLLESYLSDHINPSQVTSYWLEDVIIREVKDIRMRQVRLRATSIMYPHKLLGDVSAINVNPGYCVIDYIMTEFLKRSLRMTRQELINGLGGEDVVKEGVSVEMIENWLATRTNISMYAIDPFGKVFAQYRPSGGTDLVLAFIVNNNHVFPVLDDDVKRRVAKTKELTTAEFQMTADWSDLGVWELDFHALDKCDVKAPPVANKTILVDERDLGALALEVTRQSSQFVYNCVIPEGSQTRVAMFEHPVSGQVIVAAHEWRSRKEVLDKLMAKENYLGYVWKNQTWGLIARTIFERHVGSLPPSTYGPQLLRIYEKSTLKPLVYDTGLMETEKPAVFSAAEIRRRQERGCDDKLISVDTRRCYTAMMMNNTDPIACFMATDEVRAFGIDEKFVPGEYRIAKRCQILADVEWPSDWYPVPLVRALLESGVIERSDVTHVLPASSFYDASIFSNFATLLHESFPAESKHLVNHIIGHWGKQVERKTQGCVTSEWDVASAMINEAGAEGIKVHELGDLCFLRRYTERRLTEGYLPIWRHIIAMSIVNLITMHKRLVGPQTMVYGYNTDSIKLKNPQAFTVGKAPGDYQIEPKCHVRGYSYVSKTDGWVPEALVWKDITPEQIDGGCLVMGEGGSGKTHTLGTIALKHDKRLIVGYTRRTAENINLRWAGIGAKTLDAAYPKDKPDKLTIAGYEGLSAVFVDEFSMIQPRYMGKLWKQKYRFPTQQFLLFGDNNQTPPLKGEYNQVNYEESALVYYLCGGNRCRLPYLGQRYDEAAKTKLQGLLKTDVIEWGEKRLHTNPRMTLCKSALTRKRINEKRFSVEAKGKEVFTIGAVDWFAGMPIIAFDNDKKLGVVNSHHFVIEAFNPIIIRNQYKDQTVTVPDASMAKLFRYGWCETVQRVQGGELAYPYNIVDIEIMSRNDLYTAVSRTTKWEYIGVDVVRNRKSYPPAMYPFKCRKAEAINEVAEGVIYEKRFTTGKLFYIGRTNNEEKREAEHRRKPTSAAMAEALAQPHVTTVIARWFCTKRQLDQLETEMIRSAINRGEELANKKKVALRDEPKQVIVHKVVIAKYQIMDNPEKKLFRIYWGQKIKEFRYARAGKEATYRKAEEFREKLIKEMLL